MKKAITWLLVITGTVCIYILYLSGADWRLIDHHFRKVRNGLENEGGANYKAELRKSLNVIDLRDNKHQVLAFIHIQKTGGTFIEKKLVADVKGLECACGKPGHVLSCNCARPEGDPWMILRFSKFANSDRWPCGVHPDLASLIECIPKLLHLNYGEDYNPNVLYFTSLRDPVTRFLSEFRHAQRGGSWEFENVKCKKKTQCHENALSLKNFLECQWNPAVNRQTRMLADFRSVDCESHFSMPKDTRDSFLYKSAAEVLRKMVFFILIDKPEESQFMFEKTLSVKLKTDWHLLDTGYSKEYMKNISLADIRQIEEVNYLDVKLYRYAKQLFSKRLANLEKLFSQMPKGAKLIKNKKGVDVLQKNWKRKNLKSKIRKKKKLRGKLRKDRRRSKKRS